MCDARSCLYNPWCTAIASLMCIYGQSAGAADILLQELNSRWANPLRGRYMFWLPVRIPVLGGWPACSGSCSATRAAPLARADATACYLPALSQPCSCAKKQEVRHAMRYWRALQQHMRGVLREIRSRGPPAGGWAWRAAAALGTGRSLLLPVAETMCLTSMLACPPACRRG